MHSNAALGRKPHTVTGALVVFTCLNSKWRIALSSVAWERSMSLGLTSTFQNPPEELKNARLSGQKQSNFSEFQKKMTFREKAQFYCSALPFLSTWTAFELICFTFIWLCGYLIGVSPISEESQLPHCFFFSPHCSKRSGGFIPLETPRH